MPDKTKPTEETRDPSNSEKRIVSPCLCTRLQFSFYILLGLALGFYWDWRPGGFIILSAIFGQSWYYLRVKSISG